MKFDDALVYLGDFGTYQRRLYLLVCIPVIMCGLQTMVNVFLTATPKHRCYVPGMDNPDNLQYQMPHMNVSIPLDQEEEEYRNCRWYNRTLNQTTGDVEGDTTLLTCDRFVFDVSVYHTSIVTEWQLVCDDAIWKQVSLAVIMVGVLVGSVVFGALSDKFGRKTIFYACSIVNVGVCVGSAFSPTFEVYLVLRFFVGALGTGTCLTSFVIVMELIGQSWRTLAGVGIQMFFTVGYLLAGLFAYFIRDWRTLTWAATVPGIFIIPYWWLMPESIRWMLENNRKEEAVEAVKRASVTNRVTIPDHVFASQEEKPAAAVADGNKATALDLFRTSNMLRKSLNVFFNWMVQSLVYYGISLNSADIGYDDYLNFLLLGAVEIPALMICIPSMEKFGRRASLCGAMLIGGAACLPIFFVQGNEVAVISLAMVGKLGISASFAIIYNFSAELFPTVVRNSGMGMASMFSRLGGIAAPLVLQLDKTTPGLSMLLFGSFALLGGLLCLLLPETKGHTLPETIADGEQFGKKGVVPVMHSSTAMKSLSAENGVVAAGVDNKAFAEEQQGKYTPTTEL